MHVILGGAVQNQEQPVILVADDDESFLITTAEILKKQGYACITVSNASDALDVLSANTIHLLVSDINMPGNEDLSLLDNLKELSLGIPVILVTGTPTVDTAVKSVGLNVSSYIVKPFDIEEFLAAVKEAVQLSSLRYSIDSSMSGLLNITDQLAELREQMNLMAKPDVGSAASNYLSVLISGIVDSLAAGVTAMNSIQEGSAPDVEGFGPYAASEDNVMLVTAIKETISTLEGTKKAFKSKELGNLRKKLNIALQVIDSKEASIEAEN